MLRAGAVSLLKNGNFRLLWCAYAVSALGDHLSEMAILKTQNALDEGVDVTPMMARMTLVFMLPFFLFGPLTGFLADRLSRRRLMIAADVVRMALMAGFATLILASCSVFGSWGPFVPLAVVGVFAAVFSPARSALLPTLIHTDELVPANALIRALGVISTVVAAALGGWLADNYAPQVSFRLDALTFGASAVLVFLIREPAGSIPRAGRRRGMLDDLAGGFRYLARHRRVQQIFVVGTVFWLSASAIRSVIPAIVSEVYEKKAFFQISLFQVRLVAGMVAGALSLTVLGSALRSEIAITWSLVGAGLCAVLLGASVWAPIPVGVAFHLGGLAVFGLGFFGAALIASYNALLQRIVPNRYRGRVYGVFDVCTMAGLLLATGLLGIPRWRNLDAWVGYIVLGLAALMSGAGLVSLWVRYRDRGLPFALSMVSNFNEFCCRLWYRFQRIGPCTIPRTGPVIVTTNHTCSADPLMISAACSYRPVSFLIAAEFADIPVARWFVRLIECIPVRRSRQDTTATKEAIRRLRAGGALGIFIEGRIPEPGQQEQPKEGVAVLALRTGAPVIPAYLSGNKYRRGVVGGFFARHRTEIRFGAPVDLSEFAGRFSRKILVVATAKIFQAIQDLAPGGIRPEDGPAR